MPPTTVSRKFHVTETIDLRHRMSERTTQMLTNAVERAIEDKRPSYVISRTEYHGERDMLPRVKQIAGSRYYPGMVKFVGIAQDAEIIGAPAQIFRDHTAY